MAREYRHKSGEVVDGWRLLKELGIGGNAEVWEASRDGQTHVALKILHSRSTQSEQYGRFKQETSTLEKTKVEPGVLPFIAYSLDVTQPKAVAWLAMPIAEPIKNALGYAPSLRSVVEAMAEVAETLATLIERYNVHHRDIKPGNLYRHQGHTVVGDFGLVKLPDGEALTMEAHKQGPGGFIPDELVSIKDKDSIDYEKVDVFLLAKTLWVLAKGKAQEFPPQGHLAETDPAVRACLKTRNSSGNLVQSGHEQTNTL